MVFKHIVSYIKLSFSSDFSLFIGGLWGRHRFFSFPFQLHRRSWFWIHYSFTFYFIFSFISQRMEAMGLLRIRVRRGINLAIRDTVSSDPYVVITHGDQVSSLCFHFFFPLWLLWIIGILIELDFFIVCLPFLNTINFVPFVSCGFLHTVISQTSFAVNVFDELWLWIWLNRLRNT